MKTENVKKLLTKEEVKAIQKRMRLKDYEHLTSDDFDAVMEYYSAELTRLKDKGENDHKLRNSAKKRLADYCKNNIVVYQEPDINLSKVGSKYVRLANINGEIAKYLIKDDKLLFPDGTTW